MSLLALSMQLVVVHRGLNDTDKALEVCFDMLDTHSLNNNPQGTVATLETIADIYLGQDDKLKTADAYRTIASIHSNFKHKNIAEKFISRAKELEVEAQA